jgi:cobalt-zinc-cadmium efflux system membrane fusion protein
MAGLLLLAGCNRKDEVDPQAAAPPPTKVQEVRDINVVEVDRPERFPLAETHQIEEAPALNVTGTINPDVSKQIPVISLASGRVLQVDAKIGDTVTKGQLLLRVQSNDISTAYNNYESAVADEKLARTQLERAKILLEKGAIAQKDYEVAVDTEEKAKVMLRTTGEALRVLGASPDKPSSVIEIRAPVTGVIVEQNVVGAGGVKTLDNSPNLFTIADLSHVWVICDVYENNLGDVKLGDRADVRLNAFPDKVYKGTVSNIGPILDPNIRTAKVRLDLVNPGNMRIGMFATATFYGKRKEKHLIVPATAILHLRDRTWVFVPAGGGRFRKVEVVSGATRPGNMVEILSGLEGGQKVVINALQLSTEAGQ